MVGRQRAGQVGVYGGQGACAGCDVQGAGGGAAGRPGAASCPLRPCWRCSDGPAPALPAPHPPAALPPPQGLSREGATWAAARAENARSRDFTVNSLLYDPFRWVGGLGLFLKGYGFRALLYDPFRWVLGRGLG